MSEKALVFIGVKIPKAMADLLNYAVEVDTHTSKSELVRDALRKELERRGFTIRGTPKEVEVPRQEAKR